METLKNASEKDFILIGKEGALEKKKEIEKEALDTIKDIESMFASLPYHSLTSKGAHGAPVTQGTLKGYASDEPQTVEEDIEDRLAKIIKAAEAEMALQAGGSHMADLVDRKEELNVVAEEAGVQGREVEPEEVLIEEEIELDAEARAREEAEARAQAEAEARSREEAEARAREEAEARAREEAEARAQAEEEAKAKAEAEARAREEKEAKAKAEAEAKAQAKADAKAEKERLKAEKKAEKKKAEEERRAKEFDILAEEVPTKGALIKKILLGILTIAFIFAAVCALILTFFKDTPIGESLTGIIDKFAEDDFSGGYTPGQTPSATEATASTGSTTDESFVGKGILTKIGIADGIGTVEEGTDLKFVIEKDYGVEGITKAISFDDDIWYISEATESVHYTPEIVGFVIDYYSKLYKRINKNDDSVLKLVAKETKLYGDVEAIRKDAIVIHNLEKLRIGEIRRYNSDFYVMVEISETTNDGNPPTKVTKVLRMTALDKEIKMVEIVDAE